MANPMSDALDQSQPPIVQAMQGGVDPSERDLMIRTLYGEAGGEGASGQAAVAHVIKNRLNSGNYGDSLSSVIMAPKQFSLWNKGDPAGAKARALATDDPAYQSIGNVVDGVLGGKIADPTGGADHYYNPHVADPDWGDKLASQNDVMIGNHRFVGKVRPSDSPAPGASTAQGQQTPAMMAAMSGQGGGEEQAPPQGPQGFLQKLVSGGLGSALGIQGQTQGVRPFDFGNALTKAGIAAMARDNPNGASAMAQVPAMEARAWQPRFSTTGLNPATGKGLLVDGRTGTVKPIDTGLSPFITMPDSANKEFRDNDEYLTKMSTVNIPKLRDVQGQLANNEFDPNLLSTSMAKLQLMANSGDQNALKIANAKHWIALTHQDLLGNHSGVTTDKDADDAFEAIMPQGSEHDSRAMANAIDNMITSERAKMSAATRYQMGAMNTYGSQLPYNHAERASTYQDYNKQLDASDESWNKIKEPWMKSVDAQNAGGSKSAPPSPKFAGSHDQTGGAGSHALDFTHGGPMTPEDAAKLPKGSMFIGADGIRRTTH